MTSKTEPDHSEPDPRSEEELPNREPEITLSYEGPKSWISEPKNLRIIVWGLIILALFLAMPSAYRALKSWRATQLAGEANAAFILGDTATGLPLLKQAMTLSLGTPAVLHAAQLHNAGAGDKTSLEAVLSRLHSGTWSPSELLELAKITAHKGDLKTASEALSLLPKDLSANESIAQILVEAAMKTSQGKGNEGADLCLAKAAGLEGVRASYLKNQAAVSLLSLNQLEATQRALTILDSVLTEDNAASLPAWKIIAETLLSSPKEVVSKLPVKESLKFSEQPRFLKQASLQDQLMLADLKILSDPSRKDAVIKDLTANYSNADREQMLNVARWLNARGNYAHTVEYAGPERPRNDTHWLLVVLDAQFSQSHWKEVSDMLESPSSTGIPDAVKSLFKARIATILGNQTDAEDAWKSVRSLLPLEKPETLAYIAEYEERIGSTDQELRTMREMAGRKETKKEALIKLILLQPVTTPASKMIPLYVDLIQSAPEFSVAVGDLAYLRLLTGEDIQASAKTSQELLKADPMNLARISAAALALLRQGDAQGALHLYEGKSIDWAKAPQPWRAVHYAVLAGTGDPSAESVKGTITTSKLRTEEKDLLSPPTNKTGL
ncbi:MAG: hypothetical protein WCP41_09020 [Verrucomicrobiota bacterium]